MSRSGGKKYRSNAGNLSSHYSRALSRSHNARSSSATCSLSELATNRPKTVGSIEEKRRDIVLKRNISSSFSDDSTRIEFFSREREKKSDPSKEGVWRDDSNKNPGQRDSFRPIRKRRRRGVRECRVEGDGDDKEARRKRKRDTDQG